MPDFDEKRALSQLNHSNSLERQREARADRERLEAQKQRARTNTAAIAQTGNLEAMKLAHELDEERRERDFLDLVREENVRLRSLVQEAKIRQIDRTHESQTQINQLAQAAIIEITKKMLSKRLGLMEHTLGTEQSIAVDREKNRLEKDQLLFKERTIRELDREFGTHDIKDLAETMRHIKDFDKNG